jgi:SAM-dependent methyltransferase
MAGPAVEPEFSIIVLVSAKRISAQSRSDPRLAFFNHHAKRWDQDASQQAKTLRRLNGLKERLGIRTGMELLEVGCGTGQITGLLASWVHPARVTAIDFSPAMLERARAKGIDADFREFDICCGPPRLQAFDVALCFQSFPHFRNQAAALRSLAHSLKPGGRLLVLHFAGSRQVNAFHRQTGRAVASDRLPSPAAWRALLLTAGLRLVRLEDREGLLLLEARRDRSSCTRRGVKSRSRRARDRVAVARSGFIAAERLPRWDAVQSGNP